MSKASELEKVEQQEENLPELINTRGIVRILQKDVSQYVERSWEDQSLRTPQSAMCKTGRENESDVMDTYCESGPETPDECSEGLDMGLSPINSEESESLSSGSYLGQGSGMSRQHT
ncbi:alpha beta hydrolase [Cryptosporidium felis]|nr:alpha beta hydrolase [Cryptosporidium felis]